MKKYLIALGTLVLALGIFALAHADIYGPTMVYWSTLDSKDLNWTTGQTTDYSASGLTGQMEGMATTTSPTFGVLGQALKFNGTTSYINLGTASALNFISSSFSINCWVLTTGTETSDVLLGNGSFGAYGYYVQFEASNTVQIVTNQVGGDQVTLTSSSLTASKYQMLTVVRNGTTMHIYFNGVEQPYTTHTNVTNPISSTGNFYIGRYQTAADFFKGDIDDVRVYNTALTTSQISALYYLGAARHNNNHL